MRTGISKGNLMSNRVAKRALLEPETEYALTLRTDLPAHTLIRIQSPSVEDIHSSAPKASIDPSPTGNPA
jgi:hypothetical protein